MRISFISHSQSHLSIPLLKLVNYRLMIVKNFINTIKVFVGRVLDRKIDLWKWKWGGTRFKIKIPLKISKVKQKNLEEISIRAWGVSLRCSIKNQLTFQF